MVGGNNLRPRISKKEAEFILECLLVKKGETEKILERYEDLKAEVLRLRLVVMYDSYEAITNQKFFHFFTSSYNFSRAFWS